MQFEPGVYKISPLNAYVTDVNVGAGCANATGNQSCGCYPFLGNNFCCSRGSETSFLMNFPNDYSSSCDDVGGIDPVYSCNGSETCIRQSSASADIQTYFCSPCCEIDQCCDGSCGLPTCQVYFICKFIFNLPNSFNL